MSVRHPHPECAECNEYLERRADILPAHIVAVARRRGIRAGDLVVALSGLSLNTS